MNDREIDTIDKVCVLDQRFESLEHPVQENTTRENDTSKYLKISDLGKPRQTSKNVEIPSPKNPLIFAIFPLKGKFEWIFRGFSKIL